MSLYDLCEVNEISQLLGLSFRRALALYRTVERESHATRVPAFPTITRRHEGTIGALDIAI